MKTKLGNVQDWQTLARQANWSAVKLAKKCNVCVRTLERHFLKTTGKTPKVWLNEQRQYQAQKAIQSGLSVKESAFQLGYEHPTLNFHGSSASSGAIVRQVPYPFTSILEAKCRDLF